MLLYTSRLEQVLKEYPFRITYKNEKAIDTGGVSRDMFSAFWEIAYIKAFDGGNVLVPASHPSVDMGRLVILGTILSHGYMSSGFLPIRLAFPVMCSILLSPLCHVPDQMIMDSFIEFISTYEGAILRNALGQEKYDSDLTDRLIDIFSRFGCRDLPTPQNIVHLIRSIAKHEFLVKPLGALYALHSGIPEVHKGFWSQFTVESLYDIYLGLNATPSAVLAKIEEPEQTNLARSRVFGFLTHLIGNMKPVELRRFLRFVTGSSVLLSTPIKNNLSGAIRRPIAHTCSFTLELSTTYATLLKFEEEIVNVLSQDESWAMDI